MVHSGKVSFLQVGMLLIFMCCTCSTGTMVSLEDRLKEMDAKLEMKMSQLEEKNVRLEEKVTELESKNTQLEKKVEQQEAILTSLLLQMNQSESAADYSKSIASNGQTEIQSSGKLSGIPRTCRELRAADPSLPSGMHWIDPDGPGVGGDPIYVFCNMASGSTAILHDSESPIDVGHCADPGCYSRSINYNASIQQIKALAELSAECHQSIKYDCNYAPFEFDKVPYAWWNDRDGNSQYFWAGNNAEGIHTCQCGINRNCVDNSVNCNCDTVAPIQFVDDGIITDKNILPVTRLNFGRTQLTTSSGIHTLGRFECSGSVALTKMPTSCKDLWLIGHTLNGFYSVQGDKMMESVYCDFTKLPDNADFQKWIGYADVKSAPVYFYVQRNSSFSETYTPIPFDLARVNEGNAMDLTTGVFTAPRPGIYFFSFTGFVNHAASSSSFLAVSFYLNGGGNRIGMGSNNEGNTVANQEGQVTIKSTLKLKSGDRFWVSIDWVSSSEEHLTDDSRWHFNHFTGFMLEEEIVASL